MKGGHPIIREKTRSNPFGARFSSAEGAAVGGVTDEYMSHAFKIMRGGLARARVRGILYLKGPNLGGSIRRRE
jgi:hypothetical protein